MREFSDWPRLRSARLERPSPAAHDESSRLRVERVRVTRSDAVKRAGADARRANGLAWPVHGRAASRRVGPAWFVELNGRPWGSMALARRQGLEYPAWQVTLALDASVAGRVKRGWSGLQTPRPGADARVVRAARAEVQRARQWPSAWNAPRRGVDPPRDALYNWRRMIRRCSSVTATTHAGQRLQARQLTWSSLQRATCIPRGPMTGPGPSKH